MAVRRIPDIQPRGIASDVWIGPFDQSKKALEKEGYRVISLEENALLRIQEGEESYVSQNGNWTKEGTIYVPVEGVFLTKNSPIMLNAKEATDCHRNGKDFYLKNEQVKEALEDSVLLSGEPIPTNRFGEDKITVYAFGDVAEEYGNFLRASGISEMPVYIADLQGKPFARQLRLGRLDDRSGFGGYYRNLSDGCSRGIREESAKKIP